MSIASTCIVVTPDAKAYRIPYMGLDAMDPPNKYLSLGGGGWIEAHPLDGVPPEVVQLVLAVLQQDRAAALALADRVKELWEQEVSQK